MYDLKSHVNAVDGTRCKWICTVLAADGRCRDIKKIKERTMHDAYHQPICMQFRRSSSCLQTRIEYYVNVDAWWMMDDKRMMELPLIVCRPRTVDVRTKYTALNSIHYPLRYSKADETRRDMYCTVLAFSISSPFFYIPDGQHRCCCCCCCCCSCVSLDYNTRGGIASYVMYQLYMAS